MRVSATNTCLNKASETPDMPTDTTIGDLLKNLQTITPAPVAASVVAVDGTHDALDAEAEAIRHAILSRQNEFTAGRAAARGALVQLGAEPVAILRGEDRRPLWPDGIVGSISHTAGYAAAAVGRSPEIQGLGLDIEEKSPLKPVLYRKIMTPAERELREASPMVGSVPRCKLTFVTKEALFKSIYPITRQFFGFQEASVELHPDGSWQARFFPEAIGLSSSFTAHEGRWRMVGNVILATVCVVGGDYSSK